MLPLAVYSVEMNNPRIADSINIEFKNRLLHNSAARNLREIESYKGLLVLVWVVPDVDFLALTFVLFWVQLFNVRIFSCKQLSHFRLRRIVLWIYGFCALGLVTAGAQDQRKEQHQNGTTFISHWSLPNVGV